MKHRIVLAIIGCVLSVATALATKPANDYSAVVEYQIVPPNAPEEIVYNVRVLQQPTEADSLYYCNFLIESLLDGAQADDISFSAYFDGNFYKFKDDRFTEYHLPADSSFFSSNQLRFEMFLAVLPADIEEFIESIKADSAYTYKEYPVGVNRKFEAAETRNGYHNRDIRFEFDSSGNPVEWQIITNPGQYAELISSAKYIQTDTSHQTELSEEFLAAKYPEIFRKFRGDNFSAASLVDRPMPSFSLPMLSGRRLSHLRGKGFDKPTVFVFADSFPQPIDNNEAMEVIYVFKGGSSEISKEDSNNAYSDATVITNAAGLYRDCGVKALPTLIYCNTDGIITSVTEL